MVEITKETYEINNIEAIVDDNGILRLNKNHLEEQLKYSNLAVVTSKYCPGNKKHRFQLVEKPKKQPNRIFPMNI